jgi:hypothetical protein
LPTRRPNGGHIRAPLANSDGHTRPAWLRRSIPSSHRRGLAVARIPLSCYDSTLRVTSHGAVGSCRMGGLSVAADRPSFSLVDRQYRLTRPFVPSMAPFPRARERLARNRAGSTSSDMAAVGVGDAAIGGASIPVDARCGRARYASTSAGLKRQSVADPQWPRSFRGPRPAAAPSAHSCTASADGDVGGRQRRAHLRPAASAGSGSSAEPKTVFRSESRARAILRARSTLG